MVPPPPLTSPTYTLFPLSTRFRSLTPTAELVPVMAVLPPESLACAWALEWLALLSSTVHVAFRPIFRPGRLAETAEGQKDVAATGLNSLKSVLALLDERLGKGRSEEHTSELQSLMRISYAVFCLKKKKKTRTGRATIA